MNQNFVESLDSCKKVQDKYFISYTAYSFNFNHFNQSFNSNGIGNNEDGER